jgi:hypothetical protein
MAVCACLCLLAAATGRAQSPAEDIGGTRNFNWA